MAAESKVLTHKAVPRGSFPHVKRAGEFIYVSGTSSRCPDDSIAGASVDADGLLHRDIAVQTRAVINNIADILASMDASLDDLLELSCFLVDMDDFDGFNRVYAEYFDETGPTRTTVAVAQLPHPHLAIEMKAVAYKPIGDK